jgi:hypothetical protein
MSDPSKVDNTEHVWSLEFEHKPGRGILVEEETLAALWEVVQEVANKDTLSEHAFGGYEYCIFCSGHEYRMMPFKHEASCIVLKACALVAQNSPQSH